jgi:hypothetical protein
MRVFAAFAVLALGLGVALPAVTAADEIHLACDGTVTFPDTEQGTAFVFNSHGDSASARGYATHRGEAEDEVLIDVSGTTGRIKVPAVMMPPLHERTDDGWRPFDTLHVGDTEIVGGFSFNFIDRPSVSINRITGHVEIKGINKRTFIGDCNAYDPNTAVRKF